MLRLCNRITKKILNPLVQGCGILIRILDKGALYYGSNRTNPKQKTT